MTALEARLRAPRPPAVAAAAKSGPRPEQRPDQAFNWRWPLGIVVGLALLAALTVVRHRRALHSDQAAALAGVGGSPDQRSGEDPTPTTAALGPVARVWLRGELNIVSNGDKDLAIALVRRFEDAGALAVYVGAISQVGPTRIAGELIVIVPTDPDVRSAVLAVHQSFLRATFGGMTPPSRTSGGVLRVTL